jgi:hypothetical protein
MAVYNVTNPSSPFAAVEFTPVAVGNMTFFYVAPEKKTEAEKHLADMGQIIVSEASANGQLILVTRGSKSRDEIVQGLEAAGNTLALKEIPKKTNWWKFRGWASNVGQVLQLTSAFTEKPPGKRVEPDIFGFAVLNLAANMINIFFGGQREKDVHRLRYIKQNVNQLLISKVSEGNQPPDIEKSYSEIRKKSQPSPTVGQKFNAFMRKHSVRFGEIGLRFLGSVALVIPVTQEHWKAVAAAYRNRGIGSAALRVLNQNPTKLYAGLAYLTGKTIALFSKVPDPYNPKPPSALDRIREKYFFRTSSVIETGAASVLAIGGFTGDFGYSKNQAGKPIIKPLSGAGGAVFTAGLTTRFFAPFGTREVDTEEIFTYTSDFLARTPREKLPQLVTESAVLLSQNLSSDHQKLTFGVIYTRLIKDLSSYYNIDLDMANASAEVHNTSAIDTQHQFPNNLSATSARSQSLETKPGKLAFVNSSSQQVFRGLPSSMLKLLELPSQETGIRR